MAGFVPLAAVLPEGARTIPGRCPAGEAAGARRLALGRAAGTDPSGDEPGGGTEVAPAGAPGGGAEAAPAGEPGLEARVAEAVRRAEERVRAELAEERAALERERVALAEERARLAEAAAALDALRAALAEEARAGVAAFLGAAVDRLLGDVPEVMRGLLEERLPALAERMVGESGVTLRVHPRDEELARRLVGGRPGWRVEVDEALGGGWRVESRSGVVDADVATVREAIAGAIAEWRAAMTAAGEG